MRFSPDDDPDLEALKVSLVDAGDRAYSYGRKQDLSAHLDMPRLEFSGRSELEYFHASTIVFIRRGLQRDACVYRFWRMWQEHADFLRTRLDSRWLISACDTIMDTASDPYERLAAGAGSLFMNTVKLYETERLATGSKCADRTLDFNLPNGLHPLFDGLSAFNIGTGDMIANLFRRVRESAPGGAIAPVIVRELIERAKTHDTVFRRLANVHHRDQTRW